ncbi:hypothetical protein CASFOL_016217 [Castilleja foliolosa]|uniref:Peptidase A1 domain-containing protein n=1 Tax=Castilleja foliolosa TaxID=1961234 RepID=A0ABD3DHC0_9LAMI
MHQEMYVKALALYLLTWITAAYQPLINLSEMKPSSGGALGSFFYFPITGNVYPSGTVRGYYTVTIRIGNSPYVFDVDTGSNLTWFPCSKQGNVVSCDDPACKALGTLRKNGDNCDTSSASPCEYKVNYADGDSFTGTLVRDSFPPIKLKNGSTLAPMLALGCGDSVYQYGVLGLGKGESGILKQLSNMGVIRNIVGHCLSGQEGGFLFFGDVPFLGIVWKHVFTTRNLTLGDKKSFYEKKIVIVCHPNGTKIFFVIAD